MKHLPIPGGFEIGDPVTLSKLGEDSGVLMRSLHGVVVGGNSHGCVLVNVAKKGAKRKSIRPFRPEFLVKE